MKLSRLAIASAAFFAIAAPFLSHAASKRKPEVIVISLDAFGAESLKDPRVLAPTLRSLMKEGSYASSMRPINPTVTWPNHTSIVTGVDASRHGVIANGEIQLPEPGSTNFHVDPSSKQVLVHAPTVYDLAHAQGLHTAEVDWVAIHGADTIDYRFEERLDRNSQVVKDMLVDGSVTPEQLDRYNQYDQTGRDQIWTNAAIHILRHDHPQLLLLHYLDLDGVEHHYGYGGGAGNASIGFVDGQVRQIVDAVREAGDLDRTTFLIVSDHGQMDLKISLNVNVLLHEASMGPEKASAISEGGIAYVYLKDTSAANLERAKRALEGKRGVRRVVTSDQFASVGFPAKQILKQSPDLLVFAENNYVLATGEGTSAYEPLKVLKGGHGYFNTEPLMQSIFIAAGAGIQKAGDIGPISNIDVAPTIAALLGFSMPNVDGKVLRQILK